MSVSSSCPACGAQISVSERGGRVACPYCGSNFIVDMDATQPVFRLAGSDDEPAAEPSHEVQWEPYGVDSTQEPAALSTQVDTGYSQPADQSAPDLYTKIADAAGFPWRRFGLIAILVLTGVFCLACLCMVVIIQRFVR